MYRTPVTIVRNQVSVIKSAGGGHFRPAAHLFRDTCFYDVTVTTRNENQSFARADQMNVNRILLTG